MCNDKYMFFYPNGQEIMPDGTNEEKIKAFIEFYSRVYDYENRNLPLEKTIQKILEHISLNENDIVDILRWTIGATSYKYDEQTVSNQWGTIEAKGISNTFKGSKPAECDPKKIIENLMSFDGIGPVYAITFLYFLTRGKYPIYDRFAHIALKVIDEKNGFNDLISDSELGKEFHTYSSNVETVLRDYTESYIKRLNQIFRKKYGEECDTDRNLDRALWVYGHLFNETEANKQRILCGNDTVSA